MYAKNVTTRPSILHVEDDNATAFLVNYALSNASTAIELFRVGDGEQALAFLKRTGEFAGAQRPKLVILDLNLPRKSGMEVLVEVRGHEDLKGLAVVVLTTSALGADRSRALALGADFREKPGDLDGYAELAIWLVHVVNC